MRISDADVAVIAQDRWPDWVESHDDVERVARALAKEVAGLRQPIITVHHTEKSSDEIAQRLAAMQLGRSAVQAVIVDADPLQIEVDRLKRLLARYVRHVATSEGTDFLSGTSDHLSDAEIREIATLVDYKVTL
jgi:hypothetical protein